MWRWFLLSIVVACSGREPGLTLARKAELAGQGQAAYDQRDWATCASAFERAGDHYNAACCHAQAGARDQAFEEIARAVEAGFDNMEHLKKDPDLAPLHADPRWAAAVADAEREMVARLTNANAELAKLFADDQADRSGSFESIDWDKVSPRDRARERRVDEILAAGGAKVAADFYHAAMVHQHGPTKHSIEKAHSLALAAAALDPTSTKARWLAAASEDRLLVRQGKLQRWGTQYRSNGPGTPWFLEPFDPTTTDEERAEWQVPPIAEALERAQQMNRSR